MPRFDVRRCLSAMAALAEVLVVLAGGALLAGVVRRAVDMPTYKNVLGEGPTETYPDFLWLSGITAVELILKFGIMLVLAFTLGWILRRWTPKSYGLTLAGHRLGELLVTGWVLFAVTGLPVKALLYLNQYLSVGEGAAHWWIFDLDWTWSFWLFMAVSSFVIPPVCEEIIIRGYMQSRLVQALGPRVGIVLIALIFAAAHGQYHRLDPISMAMLASLVFSSVCLGYTFYRTQSLVPCIVAHALGNIPIATRYESVLMVAMAATIIIARKPILQAAREFVSPSFETTDLVAATIERRDDASPNLS